MSKYVISYDLRKPHRNYDDLIAAIKTADRWCHVLESVWVVWTEKTAASIFAYLNQFVDSDDGLVVFALSEDRDGHWKGILPEVSKTLQKYW